MPGIFLSHVKAFTGSNLSLIATPALLQQTITKVLFILGGGNKIEGKSEKNIQSHLTTMTLLEHGQTHMDFETCPNYLLLQLLLFQHHCKALCATELPPSSLSYGPNLLEI